jgi:hypothetical protein
MIHLLRSQATKQQINIRPHQGNPAMEILDPSIRGRVSEIARRILEGI